MLRLAEAQSALRDAIITNDTAAVLPLLTTGVKESDPTYRLSIHQRHYVASLVDLVRKRFPATEWLVGETFLAAAGRDYARANPPRRPSLGEYGEDFPAFLCTRPGTDSLPWLAEVGRLEWQLAEVAAAVGAPPVAIASLSAFEAVPLETLRLGVQTGLAYAAFRWPVDELVRLHLDGREPDTMAFEEADTRLELRGARGSFSIRRLDQATFAFREALRLGSSLAIGLAAAEAVGPFDPGAAVAALFGEGLIVDVFREGAP